MKKISGSPDPTEEIIFNPGALKVTYRIEDEIVEVPVEVPDEPGRDLRAISDGLEDSPDPDSGVRISGYKQYSESSDKTGGIRPKARSGELSGLSHFEGRMETDQDAMRELIKRSDEIDFDPLPDEETERIKRTKPSPETDGPEDGLIRVTVGKFVRAEKDSLFEGWSEVPEAVDHVAELLSMDNKGLTKEALKDFIVNRYQPDKSGY